MPNGAGVDLAREERVKKCDDIIVLFNEIKESLNLEKMKSCSNEEVNLYEKISLLFKLFAKLNIH